MLAAGFLFCSAGCGAELYEQRLENTRRLFQHMELLDSHLSGEWIDGSCGVRIRPPRQFQLVPPPAPPKKKAENSDAEPPESIEVDPRQPPYLNVELPGLRAAFVADMGAVQDGRQLNTSAYMYVLTNHVIGKNGPGDSTARFAEHLVTMLGEALHVDVKPEGWQNVTIPSRSDTFVNPLNYREMVLNPADPVLPIKDGHDRLPTKFAAYAYKQGEVQVVVLFVIPRDYNSDEQLDKRVPLCLETLVVDGDSAIRQSAPAAAPPTPGAGSPGPKPSAGF